MKSHLIMACAYLAAATEPLLAQVQYNSRMTENYSTVAVHRENNPSYYSGAPTQVASRAMDAESTLQVLYSFTILDSVTAYIYTRNCFDYAWAPYMSCMCNVSGDQNEAWWMDDPSQNWKDGSMVNVATSVGRLYNDEYYFRTADLQLLQSEYQDVFGQMLELPVCDMSTMSSIPQHSAGLVNWFTPAPLDPAYSVGLYDSKWGSMGLYEHRWGKGLTPEVYNSASSLRIFAPKPGWNPPFVIYTPW